MTDAPEIKLTPLAVPVPPSTLIIRPMEYNAHGVKVYFSGVFGTDGHRKATGDVWVATFYDRNEAEGFIMASKSLSHQPVLGIRMNTGDQSDATGNAGPQSPQVGG